MDDGKLWRNVSSPAARRVLGYLFNYTPSVTDPDLMETYFLDAPFPDREYQAKLRKMFEESDLASLIARPHLLPNIYTAMPEPWASIGRLYRPRTLEQHVKHVLKHLDWFLAPHRKLSFWVLATRNHFSVLLAIVYMILAINAAIFVGWFFGLIVLVIGTILASPLAAITYATSCLTSTSSRIPPWSYNERTRATELYRYLYYAYQDVEEITLE
jgi:hypothetical protein